MENKGETNQGKNTDEIIENVRSICLYLTQNDSNSNQQHEEEKEGSKMKIEEEEEEEENGLPPFCEFGVCLVNSLTGFLDFHFFD